MRLRKRFVKPEKNDLHPVLEPEEMTIDNEPDQSEVEGAQPPLLQPRRAKHAKQKGMTMFVFFAIFLSVVLFVGWGAGWLKREQDRTVASTQAPITVETPIAEKTVEKVTPPPPSIDPKPVEPLKTSAPVQLPQPQSNPKPEVKKPVYKQIMKHKVEPGETFYRISIKYYHTGKYANYLTKYNGLRSPSDLVSGTYIKVPYPPK